MVENGQEIYAKFRGTFIGDFLTKLLKIYSLKFFCGGVRQHLSVVDAGFEFFQKIKKTQWLYLELMGKI